jgi:oligopeptide transport system substrate-binding protein
VGRTAWLASSLLGLALVPPLALASSGWARAGSQTGVPQRTAAGGDSITFAWSAEPPSLDPALANDTVSANVLHNIMDSLVELKGRNLAPAPNLASGWRVSGGGKVVTIRLRRDGRWTNGDPVTARDFVYSWKRVLDPALGAAYAYQLFGIKGALAYNRCNPKKRNCTKLRNAVGVAALDDHTIRVTLAQPQPWFPQLLAHNVFLAVPRATVERYGEKWTEPEHIVTDGPFRLARWQHDAELDLAKWSGWRNAGRVALARVNGRIIPSGTTAVLAFRAGELDALDANLLPPPLISGWKDKPAYYRSPALGTIYFGFNVEKIRDPNQRRAMAMAIDRSTIVDYITKAGQLPADGFTPRGIAGFELIDPHSRWLPTRGNTDAAKALMAKVAHPVRHVTLYFPNAPGVQESAVAVQSMWQRIGITTTLRQQEFKQFLQFLGPPPNSDVDAYGLGWIYDFPDAINGFETLTCGSGNNFTNWCDKRFDALVARARTLQENQRRYRLYGTIEKVLFGSNGALPIVPVFWQVNVSLVGPRIRDTFRIDPQTSIRFADIRVKR